MSASANVEAMMTSKRVRFFVMHIARARGNRPALRQKRQLTFQLESKHHALHVVGSNSGRSGMAMDG